MYTILTDSCSDLNPALAGKYEKLVVMQLTYTMSGESSTKPFSDEQTVRAYYDRLRAGESCTTSQIAPTEFYEEF